MPAPLAPTAPPAGGGRRQLALAAGSALLAASAALQATIGVPHLIEDVRELALRDVGGRPRLVAHVAAGLWLGVAALALCAALVAHALWRARRGEAVAPGVLRLVVAACAAFGASLYAGTGSLHALGYVLAGALVLVGTPRPHAP